MHASAPAWTSPPSVLGASRGNQVLRPTIDLFDISRGRRFSTYACTAIRNRLVSAARKLQQENEALLRLRAWNGQVNIGQFRWGSETPSDERLCSAAW